MRSSFWIVAEFTTVQNCDVTAEFWTELSKTRSLAMRAREFWIVRFFAKHRDATVTERRIGSLAKRARKFWTTMVPLQRNPCPINEGQIPFAT